MGTDLQSAAEQPISASSPELHMPFGVLGDMQAPDSPYVTVEQILLSCLTFIERSIICVLPVTAITEITG